MASIGFEIDQIVSTPVSSLTDLDDILNQKVIEGARDTIIALKEQGHKIVFYTRRDVSTALMTEKWLDKNKIPYDQISFNRPHSTTIFFSDNTRRFTSWDNVKADLRSVGLWKDKVKPIENLGGQNTAIPPIDGVQKLKK